MKRYFSSCGLLLIVFSTTAWGQSETGTLLFDGTDTGLIMTKGGNHAEHSVVVEDNFLKASLAHGDFETTRLYTPLSQGYDPFGDEFRLRTRARVLNTSTPFRFLQWGGFFKDDQGNRSNGDFPFNSPNVLAMGGANNGDVCNGGTVECPNYLFSAGGLNRIQDQTILENYEYENGEDLWYIYEAHFDVSNSTWESWTYSDLFSPGGSQLLFHTVLNLSTGFDDLVDVFSFGATNDVDPPSDINVGRPDPGARLTDYEMDWATWSVNTALPPDPMSHLPADPADLNMDEFVDGLDLGILLGNWNTSTTPDMGELDGTPPVDLSC